MRLSQKCKRFFEFENKKLFCFSFGFYLSLFSTFYAVQAQCPPGAFGSGAFLSQPQRCANLGIPATIRLEYENIPEPAPGESVVINIDWGDGSPIFQQVIPFDPSNPNFSIAPFIADFPHTFPLDDTDCFYEIETWLIGTEPCIATVETEQNRIVSIWNTDQEFMDIEPEEYLVCVGTVADFIFTDTSPLNCIAPGIGAAQRNDRNRWTRWVYGTQYTMDGTGTLVEVENIGPVPPQQAGPVVLQPAPVLAIGGANQTSEEITVTVGEDATIGGIFEVRLENWNVCNPFEDNMGNPTGNAPSTRTARIRIVEAPEPIILAPNDGDRTCLGDPVNFTSTVNNNPGGGLTYEWTYRELPGGTETVFSTAANPSNITFPSAAEYEVILTVTNNNIIGCSISSDAIVIEFTDGPDADIEEDIASAPESQASFTTNPGNPNEIWLCWVDLLNDNPYLQFSVPEINSSTGNETVPFPDDTRLIWELLPPGGGSAVISQTVEYGDVLVPIEDNIISFNYSNAFAGGTLDPGNYNFGTYRLRLSIEQREAVGVSECSDIAEFRILLFDDPDPVLTVSPVCEGEEVSFSATGSQPAANIANYIWNFGDPGNTTETTSSASTTFTYPGPGSYKAFLNVETNFGCVGNEADTFNVLVKEVPDAEIQLVNPPNEPIFPGESYSFGNVSAFTPPATVPENFWQLADVNYMLKIVTLGTSDVEFLPINRAGEAGDEVEFVFTNTSSDNNQEYEVSIVAEGLDREGDPTCNAESAAITITVLPMQEADFGIFFVDSGEPYSESANICSPLDLNFSADAATQALDPDEYSWEIRDQNNNIVFQDNGPTLSQVSSTFEVDFPFTDRRTFTATLTVVKTGQSNQTSTKTFRVAPRPSSAFTIDTLEQECEFIRFQLTAEQEGLESYDWDVNPQNPSPSYNMFDFVDNGRIIEFSINRPEENEVNLNMDFSLQTENSFACESELAEETVTINRKVVMGVDLELVSADSEGCQPFTGPFRNETDPTDEPPGTVWELLIRRFEPGNPIIETIAGPAGNEDFRADFLYTFEDAGQFIVELRGTPPDNCADLNISTQPVTVYKQPEPRFNYTSGITEGCSPFTLGFSNATPNISTALGGPVSFEYQIENTTTGESLTLIHGGTTSGNLNGGTVSLSGNNLNTTNLRNLSGADYEYEVTLLVSTAQNCVADSTLGFTIFAEPDFEIDILSTNPACEEDYEYTFGIDSLSFPVGTTFSWDFGDGTTSGPTTGLEPVTHTFFNPNTFNGSAEFNVSLLANTPDGCIHERDVDINLNPQVQAGFIASAQEGCAPLTVNFTNQSLGTLANITWSWRVQTPGDTEPWNEFSTNPNNTSRTFQNNTDLPIIYEVRVRAEGQGACVSEYIEEILVRPRIIIFFEITSEFEGCSPLGLSIENLVQEGVIYTWDFGDGSQIETGPYTNAQTTEQIDYSYINPSSSETQNYSLQVTAAYEGGACEQFEERTIQVLPGNKISIDIVESEGCSPFLPNFDVVGSGGIVNRWSYVKKGESEILGENLGTSPDPNQFTLVNTGLEAETYTFSFQEITQQGCTYLSEWDVTVFPLPKPDPSLELMNRCPEEAGIMLSFDLREGYEYRVRWNDSLDFELVNEAKVEHFYTMGSSSQSTNITLEASLPNGTCFFQWEEMFTIPQAVPVAFNNLPQSVVLGKGRSNNLTLNLQQALNCELNWVLNLAASQETLSRFVFLQSLQDNALSIMPGVMELTLPLAISDDPRIFPSDSVMLHLQPSVAGAPEINILLVIEESQASMISFTETAVEMEKGESTNFNLNWNRELARSVFIALEVSPSGAYWESPYQVSSSQLQIPLDAELLSKAFPFTLLEDNLAEGPIEISFGNLPNIFNGGESLSISIKEDALSGDLARFSFVGNAFSLVEDRYRFQIPMDISEDRGPGTAQIRVYSDDLVYGRDFTTSPEAENEMISYEFNSDSSLELGFSLDDQYSDGFSRKVYFEILEMEGFYEMGSRYRATLEVLSRGPVSGQSSALNKSFAFYPNPVKDYLHLDIPWTGQLELSLMDTKGRLLFNQNQEVGRTLDLNNIHPGLYFLKIQQGEEWHVFRLIKE